MAKKRRSQKKNSVMMISGFLLVLLVSFAFFSSMLSKKKIVTGEKTNYSPTFEIEGELTIINDNNEIVKIDIEIADTDDQRNQGLMYRKYMKNNQGMFFIFSDSKERSFWMKNTYISLDIIFIDENFKIVSIARDTEPYSVNQINSYGKTKYVLELNSGFCEKNKININNFVVYNKN